MSLLDGLVEREYFLPDTRKMIEAYGVRWNRSEIQAIIECHVMSEPALADGLALTLGIPRLYRVDRIEKSSDALSKIEFQDALAYLCLPFKNEDECYHVALADPSQAGLQDFLEKKLGTFEKHICEYSELRRGILGAYSIPRCVPSLASD